MTIDLGLIFIIDSLHDCIQHVRGERTLDGRYHLKHAEWINKKIGIHSLHFDVVVMFGDRYADETAGREGGGEWEFRQKCAPGA